MSAARKSVIASQSVEARQTRALAIACASIACQDRSNLSAIMSLADQFQDYINGCAPEPKPDKLGK